MLFIGTACKNNVLFSQLNLLHGRADAMGAGGAGGRNGITGSLDVKGGGQAGGNSARHGAWNHERAETF